MQALFEKNLIRMKQELTDLKTAHNRGLGTIRFFRYEYSFTTVSAHKYHYVKANIIAGEPERPFVQPAEKGDGTNVNNGGIEVDSEATEITLSIYINRANEPFTLVITSTSELANIRLDHVE